MSSTRRSSSLCISSKCRRMCGYVWRRMDAGIMWICWAVMNSPGPGIRCIITFSSRRSLINHRAPLTSLQLTVIEIPSAVLMSFPRFILCDDWRYFCLENPPQFLSGYPNDGCCMVDPDTLTVMDYNVTETAKAYFALSCPF